MLRTALRLGALCAIAGCAGPAALPRDPVPAPRDASSEASALERDAEPAPSEARSLAELAVTLHHGGQLEEAEHYYRRALAVEFAEGGADADLRTRTLADLGTLLGERAADDVARGDRDAAAERYEDALALWETFQPASDALVAESLANLALLDDARGDHRRAHERLERALPLYEKTLAADDPTVLRVRALLAKGGARPNPSGASSPHPARLDPDPDPAAVARELDREGAASLDRRDYARARGLLERAVAIHERGVTAPVELGASLSYLGRTYAGLGENEPARAALERSLSLLEPVLGKFDPLTLATRASLENVRAQLVD